MIKITAVALVALAISTSAFAAGPHMVSGYTKSNGTYVAPHMSASPGGSTSSMGIIPSTPSHPVSGYITSTGTIVTPYRATEANGTRADNYSTQGNVNPYTGQAGTKPLIGK